MDKFEYECQRRNVTVAEFLRYVRENVDKRGGRMLRSDLDRDYFAAGNDLNFVIENHGYKEKSVSKPYEMQTFVRYANGNVYNEICEFTFWDDKRGTGYYYLLNIC